MRPVTNKEAASMFRAAADMLDKLDENDPVARALKEGAIRAAGNMASRAAGSLMTGLLRSILAKSSTGDDEAK